MLSAMSFGQIDFSSVFSDGVFTVTVGDCVHKFSTEDQVLEFMLAVRKAAILHPRDFILDVRDYEFGLVLD